MDNLRDEIKNPANFQPQEKFLAKNKYAIVVCNKKFDRHKTTKSNLPSVEDDYKTTMQTIEMMGIPEKNLFELQDATHQQL